jgi:hypothetical protein
MLRYHCFLPNANSPSQVILACTAVIYREYDSIFSGNMPLVRRMGSMEQELDSMNLPFLAKSVAPPWLPAPVAEARRIAYWAQWLMLLIGVAFLISGVIQLVLSIFVSGGYILACGIVNLLLVYLMKSTFFDAVDLGKFREASDKLVIWMILALLFGVIGGVMLLIAYLRIKDVFQPNYQPYPSGQYQVGQAQAPPQQYTAPQPAPVAPVPPQPSEAQPMPHATQPEPHKAEMVKCKKCAVQYPAFMRTCPNCNEPR